MELPTAEDTVFQLYTIDTRNIIFENQDPLTTIYEVGDDDNRVVYYTLHQDDDEEEDDDDEEVEDTNAVNSLLKTDSETATQTLSNIKLLTLEDGQIFLSTVSELQDHSLFDDSLPSDDNLTAIQPNFLTSIDETTALNKIETITTDNVEDNNSEKNLDFRTIQLEDGTCAFINATLWDSLIDTARITDKIEIKKKKFPCSYVGCNKVFSTAHHLTVHIRCHTGNRPYACTMEGCDKAFATGYSLKAHLRIHTGEKPYGCNMCTKNFKTSGDLQKHIRIHTGEKPFKCPIEGCDKSFTTSNIRKVHVRSHTGERPYPCLVTDCGKAFASATNYKNHMRIHSGEKPYQCSVESCGKRFTEYSSLYKHNSVHQPYKNFKCSYCAQSFKFEHTLNLHKKAMHGILLTSTQFSVDEKEKSRSKVLELSSSIDLKSIISPVLLTPEENIFDSEDDL